MPLVQRPATRETPGAAPRPARSAVLGPGAAVAPVAWDLRRLAAAIASGLLLAGAFPPLGWWPLAPLAVAVLRLVLRDVPPRRAAVLGLLHGLAFFLPLLHWSSTFVGAFPWLVLATAEAAYVAGFAVLASLTSRARLAPVWFACLWVLQEWVRSRWPFGGFPWGRLAFSQADAPTLALAQLGGAVLVSFAVALSGALLAQAVSSAPRRPGRTVGSLAASVAVLGAGLVVPAVPDEGRSAVVALIQGNVPRLGLDFNAQREAVLRNHVEATLALADDVRAGRRPQPDLVVWPENSSDVDPLADPGAATLISSATDAIGVPVLVGAVLDGPGENLSNAAIVWRPGTGPGERYVKRHPAPFAEYIPLRPVARLFSADVDRVARDFAPGRSVEALPMGPAKVADVICFEVSYDGLVRDVVRAGGDLVVVQTNNATFGRSSESEQQLAMSRLRAVEHGRSVLAVSTSGVSAVVRASGTVAARSAIFTRDVIVERVALRRSQTWATRAGDWPEAVLAGLGVGALVAAVALPGAEGGRRGWVRRRVAGLRGRSEA